MKKILLFIIILLVFLNWFTLFTISGNDSPFFYNSMYSNYSLFPYAWSNIFSFNLGSFISPFSWIIIFNQLPILIFGQIFHLSWNIVERIGFLYPFLVISVFSSWYLFKKIFQNNNFAILSSGIFLFNTYILMVVGGQMEVAISYALSPLTLYCFIKLINDYKNKRIILLTSLVLALQVLIDPRLVFIVLAAVGLYFVLKQLIEFKNNKKFYFELFISFVLVFVIPGIISLLLHAFWLLPTVIYHQNPLNQLGSAFTTTNAVQYFSFAKFENTISLLHSNWPENIFGKVSFMKPEFLLLPILAFSSLFFVSKIKDNKKKIYILYFALLGLIGAFLAKGANDPFGGIYLWMFDHFPGFQMFRDSTKWYLLVTISYSMLIPFAISHIYELIKTHKKFSIKNKILNFQNIFVTLVVLYLLFLIRPAMLGQLTGTFKPSSVPEDYIKLERFLVSQKDFSRTLWVPTGQRFSFYSPNHPEIPAQDFFNLYNCSQLVEKVASQNTERLLQQSAFKYIIVPYDSQGEIFLTERKYDNKLYLKTINKLKTVKWLKQINGFGKIGVFEIADFKDHFWSSAKGISLTYKYVSPVEYSVKVHDAKKGDAIVFVESYDSKWVAENSKFTAQSTKFDNKFNSFILSSNGNYSIKIYYTVQDYVIIGLIISMLTLVVSLYVIILLKLNKK